MVYVSKNRNRSLQPFAFFVTTRATQFPMDHNLPMQPLEVESRNFVPRPRLLFPIPYFLFPGPPRNDRRPNSPPRPEHSLHLRPHRIASLHHVLKYLIHNVFLEDSQVPVAEQILLQRLQFQALLPRHIPDRQHPKIRQPRLRAHRGQFRVVNQNLVPRKLVLPGLNSRKRKVQPRRRMIIRITWFQSHVPIVLAHLPTNQSRYPTTSFVRIFLTPKPLSRLLYTDHG